MAAGLLGRVARRLAGRWLFIPLVRPRSEGPSGVLGPPAQACSLSTGANPGLSPAPSEQRPSCCSHTVAPVTAPMAFPHRLDAPELPDFSMLKRLARDQLIYLLEQVSAGHAWLLSCVNSVALNVTSSSLSPLVFSLERPRQVQSGGIRQEKPKGSRLINKWKPSASVQEEDSLVPGVTGGGNRIEIPLPLVTFQEVPHETMTPRVSGGK